MADRLGNRDLDNYTWEATPMGKVLLIVVSLFMAAWAIAPELLATWVLGG